MNRDNIYNKILKITVFCVPRQFCALLKVYLCKLKQFDPELEIEFAQSFRKRILISRIYLLVLGL